MGFPEEKACKDEDTESGDQLTYKVLRMKEGVQGILVKNQKYSWRS